MNRRQGASLIEMLVVIAVMSVTLNLTGILFYRLLKSEQTSTRAALVEYSSSRLADQFRRDAHAATIARRRDSDDGKPLILEFKPDSDSMQSVTYTGGADKILREVIDSTGARSQEHYRVPRCLASFPEENDKPFVTLLLQRPNSMISAPDQPRPVYRSLELKAELGRDHRLGSEPNMKGAAEADNVSTDSNLAPAVRNAGNSSAASTKDLE